MDTVNVRFCPLHGDVIVPVYAHEGDAGMDLRADESVSVKPFERKLVPCGFSLAIPDGYAAYVQPRSGAAIRQGLGIINSPGLVDSNYRGELKVAVINLDPETPIVIERGDRIAQMVILHVPQVNLIVTNSLDETDRGDGGFGSSGMK